MANTIQIKRSSTASDTPSASDLAVGELAVNTADAKLFTKHSDGTIKELAGGGGGGSGDITSVTAGTGLTGGGTSGAVTVNVDTGIANGKIPVFTIGAADDDFLRIDGTSIEGRSASQVLSDIAAMPLAGGTFTGDVTLESTDDGVNPQPNLVLFRNSISPADNDDLGRIFFRGKNDAGQDVDYHSILSEIADASDGTEDARLYFKGVSGGFDVTYMQLKFGRVYLNKVARFENNLELTGGTSIEFESSSDSQIETTLTADPTADRTITLPDATGTVLTTGNSDTPTTTTSSSDADFVLVDDGGTMKKITPSNLGIGGGGGGGVTPATAYFDCFMNNDQLVSSSGTVIQFDTTRQDVGSAFSLSSSISPLTKGELTISVAGTYMVSYQITIGNVSSSRTEGQCELQLKASGGSFADVEGSLSSTYNRNSSQDETTASASMILTITANDTIRVLARRNAGSGSLRARADGCRLNLFRIA